MPPTFVDCEFLPRSAVFVSMSAASQASFGIGGGPEGGDRVADWQPCNVGEGLRGIEPSIFKILTSTHGL